MKKETRLVMIIILIAYRNHHSFILRHCAAHCTSPYTYIRYTARRHLNNHHSFNYIYIVITEADMSLN